MIDAKMTAVLGALAIAAAILLSPAPASAQDDANDPAAPEASRPDPAAADGATVVARVDDTEITAADVELAVEALSDQLGDASPAEKRDLVVNLLIDTTLLANAAAERGFDETDAFDTQMKYYRTQTLRDMYFGRVIEPSITDEALRERYDREIGALEPQPQVRARHILVDDVETARELIAELEAGADFAALAEEHSNDPGSGRRGGDLGWFGRGQMVAPFEQAAFSLAPGETTEEPVESRFGWHVIRVEDTRERPLPAFEEVEDQLRQLLVREAFMETIAALKDEARVERFEERLPQAKPAQ